MKNIFKKSSISAGFDSIIAKGSTIIGDIRIGLGQTFVVDGNVIGKGTIVSESPSNDTPKENKLCSTLIINSGAGVECNSIIAHNVVVAGTLKCESLIVFQQLSILAGANVECDTIKYGQLSVEPTARVSGLLEITTKGENDVIATGHNEHND